MTAEQELAEEHWEWLESVLDQQRQMEKKLFIDAFLHGYKHGEATIPSFTTFLPPDKDLRKGRVEK